MTPLQRQRSNYPPNGPELRYTNERAREMERSVSGFARLVNDDLYDLLKWAEELRQERDALREGIDAALAAWDDFTDPEIRVGPVWPRMNDLRELRGRKRAES